MQNNKNDIRHDIVDGLNKSFVLNKVINFIFDKKEVKCAKIINEFIIVLEDNTSVEKIKKNNELREKINKIYYMIENNHMVEKWLNIWIISCSLAYELSKR